MGVPDILPAAFLRVISCTVVITGLAAAAQTAPPSTGNSTPATRQQNAEPAVQEKPNGPLRVSGGVAAGHLVGKVVPVYPKEARKKHVTGAVVMHAIIGKDGKVKNLEVISGPGLLRQAAFDAVSKWRYKPYLLNGQPTEIDTTITVNFNM